MKRAIFLVVLVAILILATFMIGFGWHLYVPQKISEIIEREEPAEAPSVEEVIPEDETGADEEKEVSLEIRERGAYKKPGRAVINATFINKETFGGNAKITVTLYYARKQVINKTILIENIKPREKFVETVEINTAEQWNAFDIEQT